MRMNTMRGGGVRGAVKFLMWMVVCLSGPYALAQSVTVFEGARLIPGNGNAPIEDSILIVQGELITAVGRRGELSIPNGATRVDLTGKTVMPAIIDTHKHLSGEREKLIEQLKQLAYFGVGAVLSLGQDVTDVPFEVHEEMIPGTARIYTAGRGITMPEPGRSEAPIWVKNEAEALEAVHTQAARHVDILKIWVDDREGQYEKMPPAIYKAIINEAHKNKIQVAAHIFAMDDAKGLLKAGIDVFAHGVRDRDIDDETVSLFKTHPDVFLIPNLPDRGVAADMSWLKGSLPQAELDKIQAEAIDNPEAQKLHGIQARNLDKLYKAGVKTAFGTDGGVLWEHHMELENMVVAGLTPAQVIVAATKTSAELLGLSDSGVIESDNIADFIVLDANPLDDITNTRKINAVYIRGEKIR